MPRRHGFCPEIVHTHDEQRHAQHLRRKALLHSIENARRTSRRVLRAHGMLDGRAEIDLLEQRVAELERRFETLRRSAGRTTGKEAVSRVMVCDSYDL
jgi:hypothetical protein